MSHRAALVMVGLVAGLVFAVGAAWAADPLAEIPLRVEKRQFRPVDVKVKVALRSSSSSQTRTPRPSSSRARSCASKRSCRPGAR